MTTDDNADRRDAERRASDEPRALSQHGAGRSGGAARPGRRHARSERKRPAGRATSSARSERSARSEKSARGDASAGSDQEGPDQLENPEQLARSVALRKLAAQPRTRAELEEAITRAGVPEEIAGQVLDRLGEVGLVDDEAFADAWVESRHAARGLARRALAHELRRRGVGDTEIDQAVEQISPEDEATAARRLVDRKLAAQPSLRRLDRPAQVRRLAGLLARKGYSGGLAASVIRDALSELPTEGDGAEDLADAVAPLEQAED